MTTNFKPMLADEVDLKLLKYPVLTSPKLDGVRATVIEGQLLTRSLKPLANRTIQEIRLPLNLDGELIVGDSNSKSVFRDTMKIVSAHDADINGLRYFVFDRVGPEQFAERLSEAHSLIEGNDFCVPVPHVVARDESELLRLEDSALSNGFEGLMIRDINGKYKYGRATTREGTLLKMKRRLQSEAIIIGFQEQMHNANEAKVDNLGYTERSSHQANLIPTGVLGALIVRDGGVEFNVGTGFTAADRYEYWRKRHELIGSLITYEYLPVGVKDKPRHPVFLGFRMKEDT